MLFIPITLFLLLTQYFIWRALKTSRITWLLASCLTSTNLLAVAAACFVASARYHLFSFEPLDLILGAFWTLLIWCYALIPGTVLGTMAGRLSRRILRSSSVRVLGCNLHEKPMLSTATFNPSRAGLYLLCVGMTTIVLTLIAGWSVVSYQAAYSYYKYGVTRSEIGPAMR